MNLEECYVIFDKDEALELLKDEYKYCADPQLEDLQKIIYFIRKFSFELNDLKLIGADFPLLQTIKNRIEESINEEKCAKEKEKLIQFMCLSLKYCAQNTSADSITEFFETKELIDWVRKCNSIQVNAVLIFLLTFLVDKQIDPSPSEFYSDIRDKILNNGILCDREKNDCLRKLEKIKPPIETDQVETNEILIQSFQPNFSSTLKVSESGVKTIQAQKFKQINKITEEINYSVSMIEVFKRKICRITENNNSLNDVEPTKDEGGSDTSFLRTKWRNIEYLYNLVSEKNQLKAYDKDTYLPDMFLKDHSFFEYSSILFSFFKNRMIAKIFREISKKQPLSDKAIGKLMLPCTSLENFKSILFNLYLYALYHFKVTDDNMTEFFVNIIFSNYNTLNNMSTPDLMVNFMKDFLNEIIDKEETANIKLKSYNKEKVKEKINKEINQIRIDSLEAYYNAAVLNRNALTLTRFDIINKFAIEEEDDPDIKICITKILKLFNIQFPDKYAEIFSRYMEIVVKKSTNYGIEDELEFIYRQSSNEQRCKELFNETIINQLIDLLNNSNYTLKDKETILQILKNYFEHYFDKELSTLNMKKFVDIIFESKEPSLLNDGFYVILILADRHAEFWKMISMELVINLDPNEFNSNYRLCVLYSIIGKKRDFLSDTNVLENISQFLMSDDVFYLNEDTNSLKFEKNDLKNNNYHSPNQISLISARIILESTMNKVEINSKTIDNLIGSLRLNEHYKQTRIALSKCLYYACNYIPLDIKHLYEIKEFTEGVIYDIKVHMHSAYLQACLTISKGEKSLDSGIMQSLDKFFMNDSLCLNDQDFSEEINKNFLSILFNEAKKHKFNEEIYSFFDRNLCELTEEIVNILLEHLKIRSLCLPENTVREIENVFSNNSGNNFIPKIRLLLKKLIIEKKQSVTNRTLNIFIEELYKSDNKIDREESFEILKNALKYQDVSDEIFLKYELANAGYFLNRADQESRKKTIQFIEKHTRLGLNIPLDTCLALCQNYIADNEEIFNIFLNLSKNEHYLCPEVFEYLETCFINQPIDNKFILIEIFYNAVKNRQILPRDLTALLETYLNEDSLVRKLIPILIYNASSGETISELIFQKTIDLLSKGEENLDLKLELISGLGQMISKNSTFLNSHSQSIENILIAEIESGSAKMQNLCTEVISSIAKSSEFITDRLLDQYLKVGLDSNLDDAVRRNIYGFFKLLPESRTEKYMQYLELAMLNIHSDQEYLSELRKFIHLENGFLPQNYLRLSGIINTGLKNEVLKLLMDLKNKKNMNDQLLDDISILYESTSNLDHKRSCFNLIKSVAEDGKTLTGKAENINREQDNLTEISKTPVYLQLKNDFQLNRETIQEMFDVLDLEDKFPNLDTLDNLFELVDDDYTLFYKSEAFCSIIYRLIEQDKFSKPLLKCFCRIVKEKIPTQIKKHADCIVKLCSSYEKILRADLLALFIETIYSLEIEALPKVCLEILEINLENNCANIRRNAFKCLRKLESEKLKIWLEKMLKILNKSDNRLQSNIDLDHLGVIVSLKFLDMEIFEINPKEVWKRELLISSLFETFKFKKNECVQFYEMWFQIEQRFNPDKSLIILDLINSREFNSKAELLEMISFIYDIKEIEYDDLFNIFNIHQSPLKHFKIEYLKKKVRSKLTNSDSLKEVYLCRVVRVCLKLEFQSIKIIFDSLNLISNIKKFIDIIEFCSKENVQLKESEFKSKNLNVDELENFLFCKSLCDQLEPTSDSHCQGRNECFKIFSKLISLKQVWDYGRLKQLIGSFQSNNHINLIPKNLAHILTTICDYKLNSRLYVERCNQILRNKHNLEETMKEINKLAIENVFQTQGHIKSVEELLSELKKLNPLNKELIGDIESGLLNTEISIVNDQCLKSEIYKNNGSPICKWIDKDINRWSDIIKKGKVKFKYTEAIAVIKRAYFLVSGNHLLDTQILSCLIALKYEEPLKSILLEVKTGEGKSIIICILAIISALQQPDKQVHVITSSPVLAERDAKKNNKLFSLFNLTCDDNRDKSLYTKNVKHCYKCDIVYGDASQFEFDFLRHHYNQLNTLGERKWSKAILDEVDKLMIDDACTIARLTSPLAGMDHFKPLYIYIWIRLNTIKERLININGQTYFFYQGKISVKNENIILEYSDDDENSYTISDLATYVTQKQDISQIGHILTDNWYEFLKKQLEKYVDELMKEKTFSFPTNLIDFVKIQKSKWIENAIDALIYKENVNYVIQDGKIKPVDYNSTGIVQSSMSWRDGLHQFLALKHCLQMNTESFNTSFLSNYALMKKYEQLFGLTGTLGSERSRRFFRAENVYNVELVNMPESRQKQYLNLDPIIVNYEDQWLTEIVSAVLVEVKKARGVLLICETIEQALKIEGKLLSSYKQDLIKLYTINDTNQEKNVQKILPREVIIATNLAGRGTDIETNEIEQYGGLHVILTFLPSNKRVELQNMGRTSRQGKRGTGLMILKCPEENVISFKDLESYRDKKESDILDKFENEDLRLIKLKDQLFERFCKLLNEIRNDIRNKELSFKDNLLNKVTRSKRQAVEPSFYETCMVSAIEEIWALFLLNFESSTEIENNVHDKFDSLEQKIKSDYTNNSLIKNPYYLTCIGNHTLINNQKEKKALESFSKAVGLESENKVGTAGAFVGKAWCSILLKEENYKKLSLEYLNEARSILANEITLLESTQIILQLKEAHYYNSDLFKQLNTRASIIGSYLNSVQGCIRSIKKSLRFMEIKAIYENSSEEIHTEQFYYEIERTADKKICKDFVFCDNLTYSLLFNDLTVRDDLGNRDQAIETITNNDEILESSKLNKNISIIIKKVNCDRIYYALFCCDKIFKSLDKNFAVKKLHELNTNSDVKFDLITTSTSDKSFYETINGSFHEITDALENSNPDTNFLYDVVVKEANKNFINESFQNKNQIFTLNIEFFDIESESSNTKLLFIKAQSIHAEMVLKQSHLIKLVKKNQNIESVKILNREGNSFERFKRDKLPSEENRQLCVKFEFLDADTCKKITSDPDLRYSITFNDIFDLDDKLFSNCDDQVDVYINEVSKTDAIQIIQVLRNDKIDFSLQFNNLKSENVRKIIEKASIDQEDLKIKDVKNLCDLYPREALYDMELLEFASRGIEFIIKIDEKVLVPFRTTALLTALGCSQILISLGLFYQGISPSVTSGILLEGLSDITQAITVYKNREFNWKSYCAQKGARLAISVIKTQYGQKSNLAAQYGSKALKVTFASRSDVNINPTVRYGFKMLAHFMGKFLPIGLALPSSSLGYLSQFEIISKTLKHNSEVCIYSLEPQIKERIGLKVKVRLEANQKLNDLFSFFYERNLEYKIDYLKKRVLSLLSCKEAMQHYKSISTESINLSSVDKFLNSLDNIHQVQNILDLVVKGLIENLEKIKSDHLFGSNKNKEQELNHENLTNNSLKEMIELVSVKIAKDLVKALELKLLNNSIYELNDFNKLFSESFNENSSCNPSTHLQNKNVTELLPPTKTIEKETIIETNESFTQNNMCILSERKRVISVNEIFFMKIDH